MLYAVADVLPDTPLFWVITPVRVVVIIGLLALLPRRPRLSDGLLPRAFDVCAVALMIAAAWPAHVYGAWSAWRGLVTCIGVAYLAAGVLRTRESWRALTLVSFVAVATGALPGLRQTVNGIPTGFCRGALDGSADSCGNPGMLVRALGTFGNPNLLAAFLVLVIPLAVAYAMSQSDRGTRVVAMLVPVAGVLGVVATGSRAGMLALVASLVAFLVLRTPTMQRLIAGGVAVAGVLVAGAVALLMGSGIGVREDVWRTAVGLVPTYPLGVGLGRTGDVLAAAVPGKEQFRHAHNLWLDMLPATGPLGLVAILGITILAAVHVVRGARRGSPVAVVLGSALAGFAVYCLVDNPLNAIRNAYAAWAILGLTLAISRENSARAHGAQPSETTDITGPELPNTDAIVSARVTRPGVSRGVAQWV